MTHSLKGYLNFFRAGLSQRTQTGALVPSQRFLIAKMIDPVPEAYDGLILELGAGIGALTLRLAARCQTARILACEINPILARECEDRLANAGLNDRVTVVSTPAEKLLSELGWGKMEKPGFIISGIPLGSMAGERACHLLDAIRQRLGEDGMYIQFQHSLLDRKYVKARFSNTRTIPAFLNLPPAVVYLAQC